MTAAVQRISWALVRVPGVLRVPERCFFSLVVWLCSNGRASCGERKWGLINAKSMCDGCLTRMQSRFSRFMSTRHTHTRAPCRNRQMKSFPASSACHSAADSCPDSCIALDARSAWSERAFACSWSSTKFGTPFTIGNLGSGNPKPREQQKQSERGHVMLPGRQQPAQGKGIGIWGVAAICSTWCERQGR